MNEVESLIPHRAPFLLVDEIVSADEEEIIGVKTYDDSFIFSKGLFPERNMVPGVILVESLGQCGGAGIKKMGICGDALYGFASMENVRFLGKVEVGKTVKMIVRNLKISSRAIKQSGVAYCDGKPVAKATWMCLRLD